MDTLVGVIFMSHRRHPQRILHGEPESPVSPQSTFPAQEIFSDCIGAYGAKGFEPDIFQVAENKAN